MELHFINSNGITWNSMEFTDLKSMESPPRSPLGSTISLLREGEWVVLSLNKREYFNGAKGGVHKKIKRE